MIRADAYLETGKTEQAIQDHKTAFAITQDFRIYANIAQAYKKTGQRQLALETYRLALSGIPADRVSDLAHIRKCMSELEQSGR